MVTNNTLLQLGATPPDLPFGSEAAYHEAWQACVDASALPASIAYTGGYLADRLAFLFIAGYQAAVRATFDIPGNGWAALAVSEDQRGELPGLTEGDGVLNGCKTWVASAACLAHLIVSARHDHHDHGQTLYLLPVSTPGLEMTLKDSPSFLGEMSQGIARFNDVRVESLATVHDTPLKVFARREPLYLYLAFAGFLDRNGLADPQLTADLITVATDSSDAMEMRQLFADIDQRVHALFEQLPAELFHGNLEQDRGLIGLYSASIQRRSQPRPG